MLRRVVPLAILIYLTLVSVVYAHDNKVIHPFYLSGKAMTLLSPKANPTTEQKKYQELLDYFYENISEVTGYHTGSDNYDQSKITKKGSLGSIIEDDGVRPVNHFFNPDNPPTYEPWWGSIAVNAREWGRPLWKEAVAKYGEGDKESSYKNLGQVCHLVEDMSSPPHVHGDFHVLGSGNYEAWCLPNKDINNPETQARLAYFENLFNTGNPQIQPISSYDSAFTDLAKYTYDAVKIEAQLHRDKNNPVDGDLEKMFPANGVAYLEYVEPNLLDWNGYWKIAGVGDYENAVPLSNNDWWEINNTGYFYIENCRYCIPARYVNTACGIDIDNTTANQSISYYWAGYPENLIIKTDEYIAGLLKYFYDLVNEPPYVKKVTVTQAGTTCYEASWDWVDGQLERTLTPDTADARNPKIVHGQADALVTIEFSEKVKDVNVTIGSVSATGALAGESKIWAGVLTIAELKNIGSGRQTVTIQAKDLTEQQLDGNPKTLAKYNADTARKENYEDENGGDPEGEIVRIFTQTVTLNSWDSAEVNVIS